MGSSPIQVAIVASVAQLVEQGTENPRVVGSIPTGGTSGADRYADLAHLVERDLAKVEVAGSSPVIRSKNRTRKVIVSDLVFRINFVGLSDGLHRIKQSR